MNYSSRAGHDLQNHDVFISSILSDEICKIFYDKKDKFECFDFGAGVFDISVENVLEILPSSGKIRTFIGKKYSKEQAKEIYDALMAAKTTMPYIL